ncbi:MAG TPA: hypothetical protein VGW39_05535 [Chthoniobacterales bacterium]|nr:hypothetical protein [Chthoniobacterales bacterium]
MARTDEKLALPDVTPLRTFTIGATGLEGCLGTGDGIVLFSRILGPPPGLALE